MISTLVRRPVPVSPSVLLNIRQKPQAFKPVRLKEKDCPSWSRCKAPLCPLSATLDRCEWYPAEREQVCTEERFQGVRWVKAQREIARLNGKHRIPGYFTVGMLKSLSHVPDGVHGENPDQHTDGELQGDAVMEVSQPASRPVVKRLIIRRLDVRKPLQALIVTKARAVPKPLAAQEEPAHTPATVKRLIVRRLDAKVDRTKTVVAPKAIRKTKTGTLPGFQVVPKRTLIVRRDPAPSPPRYGMRAPVRRGSKEGTQLAFQL